MKKLDRRSHAEIQADYKFGRGAGAMRLRILSLVEGYKTFDEDTSVMLEAIKREIMMLRVERDK
jgi:hypothetical protein